MVKQGYIVNFELMVDNVAVKWGNYSLDIESDSPVSANELLNDIQTYLSGKFLVSKSNVRVVGLFKV